MSKTFREVLAWQRAHAFVLRVYQVTRSFPREELFGLTSQFRRAAVSIEANIAEGFGKVSRSDKLRFMNISQGSLEECRDYVILSLDLGYMNESTYAELNAMIEETSRFLHLYVNGIKNNSGIID